MGSAAINPSFTSQGSRPLPVFFGYASASGDTVIPFIMSNGTELNYVLICDGEWDGVEQACFSTASGYFSSTRLTPATLTPAVNAILQLGNIYVHNGQWTPIGIPQTPFSYGPDQGYDSLFGNIPSVTPPQAFNNIGYIAVQRVPVSGIGARVGLTNPSDPLAFYGILRGARCRYFNSSGQVTGYGFTTNPTWHIVEALLRYKFKRQQPQIAGLTAAEIACFNWPSIVAHAAYNDGVLANGAKRYTGNYVFASQGTLAAMLETMLRCCQSYIDDQDGQIGLYHYQAQDSSFSLTANHLADPSSFKVHKKDLTNAPNIFVPKFRDLNIQALIAVSSMAITNAGGGADASGYTPLTSGIWGAYFETGGQNPFVAGNVFYYGDGSNPALNHDYVSLITPIPVEGTTPDPLPNIWAWVPGDITATASSTGGFIGTQSSRFGQRSPNTVQHSRHQLATGNIAPGIAALPNRKPVEYDLGNMSYDQANRLMQYQMNSQLGNDVPGWVAPVAGTMKVRLEAVDAAGNAFVRMRPGQRFTIDETISPELAVQGITDFLIDNGPDAMKVIPPSKSEPLGAIEISFHQYNANAFTDVSYTPDSSLQTIASAALQYVNSSLVMSNVGWVIQATPSIATAGDGSLTLTIPDLVLQELGNSAFTEIGSAVWTEIPNGEASVLFYDLSTRTGVVVANASLSALLSSGTVPFSYVPILAGTFTPTVF